MEMAMDRSSPVRSVHGDRVLVFSVDDGLFGIHLDWVEAVYEANAVELHRVRVEKGPWHSFLLHRGGPALHIDLRDAFDIVDVVGQPERAAWAVVQSGGYKLAVAIDHVAGVQDVALAAAAPVPANLLRDGGIPVGHLLQQDERMLAVLDPHRLLSGGRRDALEPIWLRAVAYAQRHAAMQGVWAEISAAPDETNLRTFARLCARNGRPKAAAAARAVVKAIADPDHALRSNGTLAPAADVLVTEILRRCSAGARGVVEVRDERGDNAGSVFLVGGRVIDAQCGAEWGRLALRRLLAESVGTATFRERDLAQHPERISESCAALLISSLEAAAVEQRRRRAR